MIATDGKTKFEVATNGRLRIGVCARNKADRRYSAELWSVIVKAASCCQLVLCVAVVKAGQSHRQLLQLLQRRRYDRMRC